MPRRPPIHGAQPPGPRPRDTRPSAAARGYDGRWRKARLAFLREHPLCAECLRQNRTAAAVVVDHRIPHQGDPAKFWDVSEWEALCRACHSRKTAGRDRGFGNPPG